MSKRIKFVERGVKNSQPSIFSSGEMDGLSYSMVCLTRWFVSLDGLSHSSWSPVAAAAAKKYCPSASMGEMNYRYYEDLKCIAHADMDVNNLVCVKSSSLHLQNAVWTGSIWYPRMNGDDPLKKMMANIQIKQNNVMRVLAGKRKIDRVPISQLLEQARMTSVNRMTVETILMEMWRLLNGDMADEITTVRSRSTVETRSRTEGKLDVERPASNFRHFGAKLWNSAPEEVRNAKTKLSAKRAIKMTGKLFPM
jgi:hypothetical protein